MDKILQILETTAKIVGWITVIVGGIVALLKLYKNMKSKLDKILDQVTEQTNEIKTMKDQVAAQGLSLLRLTVMTDSIPLSERIAAGREYIEKGGNGEVKEYIETHLLPFDKIVREKED